jgi:hypothetical protein
LFWLVFDTDDGRVIVLQPASTLIFARMSALVNRLVEGKFVEGFELEQAHIKRVPKRLVGKAITASQAEGLLRRLST